MVENQRFINWRDSSPLTIRLRNFGIMQQALCKELLGAQQLGICKITTLANGKQSFKSLDSIYGNGKDTILTDITLTNVDSKGTLF